MSDKKTVGFIGTGRMGRPMIQELLKKGYLVKVYDKFKSTADSVVAAGAVWADSPREAATGSHIVITCLPLPEHVLENMMGENGALAGMAPGSTWVDTSTTDYHNTLYLAGEAKARGVYSIEGPVSNLSHMGVDFANSSIYCAGDKEGYDEASEVLNTITKIAFFTGDRIGTAQTTKLLTNLLFYGPVSIVGDCFAISQEAGIPNYWMWEFAKKSKGHSVASGQFMPLLLDGSYDSSCTLEIGVKDMSLTESLADELGVSLELGRVINWRYATAGRVYDQQDNHLKVIKLTEDSNDIKIRIPDFKAPSKYGIDKSYVPSGEVVVDQYGRQTPRLPDYIKAPAFTPTPEQLELANTLTGFMEHTNYVFVEEAYALGQAIGLSRELIQKMILWSVGTCWVFENFEDYTPSYSNVERMKKVSTRLYLPLISACIEALDKIEAKR
ncbi:2-hydroxy-3-oxopropionate reductase [compost metagenome]|uniref:3-hydroxyisobutyrate dehydrogenase n=1 Tax=Pseudomonas jinjuensis TaxID=198616 RepID=A0A1H0DLA8_9PSED|nr:NAD(P)-dependent oxidoreductase [Pseudomonas jinjuensis]SDN70816.1 3-hydroxyisobutyrate dehydrogenase [Pseudomonas jinjuensis]